MTWADLPSVDMLEWQDLGRCKEVDPEAFFPEKGENVTAAKKICRTCEVRDKCLKWAIDSNEEYGIWGGMARETRLMFRRNKIEPTKSNIDDYLDAEVRNRELSFKTRRKYI